MNISFSGLFNITFWYAVWCMRVCDCILIQCKALRGLGMKRYINVHYYYYYYYYYYYDNSLLFSVLWFYSLSINVTSKIAVGKLHLLVGSFKTFYYHF